MPEISEVRVVRDVLKRQIVGKKIVNVKVYYPEMIEGDANVFIQKLKNLSFADVKSYGKWLMFNLGEYSILSHLRMEGKYFYVKSDSKLFYHTHIIITLNNGMDLRYNDVRKFGKMILVKTNEIYSVPEIKKLGLEPENPNLNPEYLMDKFKKKRIPIKTSLLDQTIINGLGNIYVNEVLFASKISPKRETQSISYEECSNIIKFSKIIIKKSYEMGGCTIRSYTSSLGVIGKYQNELKVHGKDNQLCSLCGTKIEKILIGGRGTYFCPNCQK